MEHRDFFVLAKIFLYSLILLTIVFYNEPFFSILRYAFSLSIMTYVPGYFLTKKLLEQDDQRLLFGSMISLTIIGVTTYYLGLIGVNVHISSFMLPTLLVTTGIIIEWKKK